MKSASRKPQPKRKYFKSRGFSRLFCFSWEQRKAKEICSIGAGKSNTQDQVDDGKYPFYIRSDVPVRSNKYLYDCEAVITIGDGNIGKVFHYVNGKFDLHQRCYKMTDFQDIWGKYFFYYFSTKFYDRAMKMTAKATVDSVRLEMISEMDIKKPPRISEQKLIADFFTSLDHLITLHQRERKNRLFGGKNVKQYNFSRLVLQLLRAMDSRLQRRGSSQGDYG
jgi:type I restriction enzyme, S subunit